MKKIISLLLSVIVLASCSKTFYQVFSINAEGAVYTPNGSPLYVDDGLEFTYNFWGENGNVRFIVYNSNDYDVIVDLKRSSFIRNNIAEDYYQGRRYETRVSTGVFRSSKDGVSIRVDNHTATDGLVNYLGKTYDVALSVGASLAANTEVGNAVKKEWQTSVSYDEPDFVRIPAKSAKAFCTFNINSTRILSRKLKTGSAAIEFSKTSSPLEFRNRICIYKEGDNPSYYDMDFYIEEIGNVVTLSGLTTPTSFYIPYSSKLETVDYHEDVFGSKASETLLGSIGEKENKSKEREIIIYYNKEIDRAVTGEELTTLKREIKDCARKGDISDAEAEKLYEKINKALGV